MEPVSSTDASNAAALHPLVEGLQCAANNGCNGLDGRYLTHTHGV